MSSEKQRLLTDAIGATQQRGDSYGDAHIHFARTIGAINRLFAHKLMEDLTPSDWAMMMMIDKIAREQQTPKRDNALDIAGYAACLAQCRMEAGGYGTDHRTAESQSAPQVPEGRGGVHPMRGDELRLRHQASLDRNVR